MIFKFRKISPASSGTNKSIQNQPVYYPLITGATHNGLPIWMRSFSIFCVVMKCRKRSRRFNTKNQRKHFARRAETTLDCERQLPDFFISAKTKENLYPFRDFIYEEVKRLHIRRYPYDKFLY
jgi:hypothetical protein